ncbi:MAG TPA: CocE/NonD family hydrolase, partial [Ktedonobacterales bacterium]
GTAASQGPGIGMTVLRDVMVSMRDGVRLATDIYLPTDVSADAPFPVIIERTPYDKSAVSRSERSAAVAQPRSRSEVAAAFVQHGYVVVYQDCRGRHHSDGSFTKYVREAQDGYDTIAWVRAQPWCNGRIGTMGLSYAAHTQVAAGCLNPPGLVCQVVDCGGFSNAYQGGIRQGGAFELKQATWAHRSASEDARDDETRAALAAVDIARWFERLPWRLGDSPVTAAPDYEAFLFDQWTHGAFDDYWKEPGLYAQGYYHQYAPAATVHLSGWYDVYARTATENYMGLVRQGRGPVQLVMGPWTHGDRSLTYAGDVDFGAAATLDGNLGDDFVAFRLRWFDRWLKQIQNGVDDEAPVRIFVMGGGSGRRTAEGRLDHGGSWRAAAAWPLPATAYTPVYLHADGRLDTTPPTEDAAALAYDFDPRHPVPSIGGTITSGLPVMTGGAYDQREHAGVFGAREPYQPLAQRPDVLVFQTPPLEADLEVTGPISVKLWIASDCSDTDFTAKLIDVYPPNEDYPDGFAMNITDGILRVRYRDSWAQPALMTPSEVYAITIEPFPTSNVFVRGHRLRLDISSSNFPHFDVNPNSGEPEGSAEQPRIARNRVLMDRAHPSHIMLPVIPHAT